MLEAMITIRPNRTRLLGSSAGVADLGKLTLAMQAAGRPDTMVNFDFTGVEAVNASYLRATLLWAMRCGQAEVRGEMPGTGNDLLPVRPYPLYPIITGWSPEVAVEVAEFVFPRDLAALLHCAGKPPQIEKVSIVGHLDKFLWDTLSVLSTVGDATAQQLAASSQEKISANGWSNRLMELYLLRLVHRERSGKFWIYKPIAKEHTIWASTS